MNNFMETKRLIIKPTTMDNFENIYHLVSDPEVMRYVDQGIKTREQTREYIEKITRHHEKHGFSVCDIFTKETGEYVGRAGLIYFEFNDAQPDIEMGYLLHKKFWKQGYATELAKAFIRWGFKHLPVNVLLAGIHPENNESRRVLENVGMHYLGKVSKSALYEILKNTTDFSKITLIPASLKEYPILQNIARFYVYDMSEYLGHESGWEIPEDGLYECIDFKKYWETKDAFPFLIRYENELAGFVIIDKKGSHPEIDFNVAQFFILRKFKNKGIGRYVAHHCFDQFKGVWEVMVMPGNEGAYRFWRSIIKEYNPQGFSEYTRTISHFRDSIKNIFKFESRV